MSPQQDDLFEPHFNGPEYVPARDHARLTKQLDRIRRLMLDGRWRTLKQIATITHDPETSVSAQLRHLRKPRFGSYIVNRRHSGDRRAGLFEYQLRPPQEDAPQ